jgi:hypothetical protein
MTYTQKKAKIDAYKKEKHGFREKVIRQARKLKICGLSTACKVFDKPIESNYPPAKHQQVIDLAIALMDG